MSNFFWTAHILLCNVCLVAKNYELLHFIRPHTNKLMRGNLDIIMLKAWLFSFFTWFYFHLQFFVVIKKTIQIWLTLSMIMYYDTIYAITRLFNSIIFKLLVAALFVRILLICFIICKKIIDMDIEKLLLAKDTVSFIVEYLVIIKHCHNQHFYHHIWT